MEINFQQQAESSKNWSSKMKGGRSRGSSSGGSSNGNKFVGVRQRASGRWVAEIKDTTQKIRMWLGTFETAEEAARAYDEAACLLRGSNTRTNFSTSSLSINSSSCSESPIAFRIRNLLNTRRLGSKLQPNKYTDAAAPASPVPAPVSIPTAATINAVATTTTTTTCSRLVEHSSQSAHTQLFDYAYKPDMESNEGSDMAMAMGFHGFSFAQQAVMEFPKSNATGDLLSEEKVEEFSEFERMKAERQISASLYAMNGVHEYIETVFDPNEPLWDLPPLCSLFC